MTDEAQTDSMGVREEDRRNPIAFAIRSLALLIARHRLPGSSPVPLETLSAEEFIDNMVRSGWKPPVQGAPLPTWEEIVRTLDGSA